MACEMHTTNVHDTSLRKISARKFCGNLLENCLLLSIASLQENKVEEKGVGLNSRTGALSLKNLSLF